MDFALQRARPVYLPVVMELAYLLYTRISEVLELTRSELKPEGVLMRRRKDSKDNLVKRSPRLETAINRALGMPSTIASMYVLHDKAGQPLKNAAVRNMPGTGVWHSVTVTLKPLDWCSHASRGTSERLDSRKSSRPQVASDGSSAPPET